MRPLWAQPAQEALDWATADPVGLWSAVQAAENAVGWLAHSHPQLPGMRCTLAAADLICGREELAAVAPEVLAGAVVDLGPVTPLDDVAACWEQAAGLLRGILALADEVLRAGGPQLGARRLAAVAHVVHHVSSAYRHLTGELP
jgi:hypothetical protein